MSKSPLPHSQFVHHSNGQTTHYIVDNFTDPWKHPQVETVLIQPGFGRHSAFWYHWVPVLAKKYNVIRRDLRGHGLSSDPTNDYAYTLETVLSEIVDLLDQENVQKIHLLGESTGGMIAVAFAAKYPDRVGSLTVCATPTHLPASAKESWALGYSDWPTACRTLGGRGFCEAMTMSGGIGQPDPSYQKWWLDQASISTGEGLARYAEFLMGLDVRPLKKTVSCPTLILAPLRSRNTSIDDQEAFRDSIKGAELVPIDGQGHEIYVDRARECQEAFVDFLNRISV
ncbi:hypothetical protein FE257_008060 [Aspergillus nanangensis]|uniref:AB hydrolase-1 domain-containing protein n=1 Tax=Aspergillus nanangensis TaxID=2582783 RepID=A0AAD4CNQ2_ASPNN|nr:hypothetical protein FE257_008060 [Aspergillus nanangensis]